MLTTMCGSPCYVSPEMLSRQPYDGIKVDLWASGIILFAMVNGRLPFNDQNLNTLLDQTKKNLKFQAWVSKGFFDHYDFVFKYIDIQPFQLYSNVSSKLNTPCIIHLTLLRYTSTSCYFSIFTYIFQRFVLKSVIVYNQFKPYYLDQGVIGNT